jgi:hypothetical protein
MFTKTPRNRNRTDPVESYERGQIFGSGFCPLVLFKPQPSLKKISSDLRNITEISADGDSVFNDFTGKL